MPSAREQLIVLGHNRERPAVTLQGADVAISVSGSTVKINDATVITADVLASNGVIHVIDTVLVPK